MSILQTALHSPLFTGGAALGIVGGAIAYARNVPNRIWNLFLQTFTIAAEIPDSDAAFDWLQVWIDKQPASKRIRDLSVNTELALNNTASSSETIEDRRKQILLAPAVGNHFLRFRRQVMWLSRQRTESKDSDSTKKKVEYWHIRLFGRNQNIIRDLIAEAREVYREVFKRPSIMINSRGYWSNLGPLPERTLESVILSKGVIGELIKDIELFLTSKHWYTMRGIPYRRGYMFQGPPGTGKSSLVIALAHKLDKPVYVINLGGMGVSDELLIDMLHGVPNGAIVLLEDIDATTRKREKKVKKDDEGKTFVSLSGLLNALDGLVAKDGRILIMTTNYPDQLDDALTRPGRVDKTVEFDYLTSEQAEEFYTRFFGPTDDARIFGRVIGGKNISPATCQEHLLCYRDNAGEALVRAKDLIK